MGIQDRDYYRDGSNGFLNAWGRQGVVLWLLVITSFLFSAELLTGGPKSELYELGKYSFEKVLSGQVWRLITPIFLHENLWNLVLNMVVLYWTGKRLEELYGAREIVLYYLISGLFAEGVPFLSQLAGLTLPITIPVGANGSVLAVLVLFAIHYPQQRIPVWILVALYVALDILGVMAEKMAIAYLTYASGVIFGFLYYHSGIRFSHPFIRSTARPVAKKVRPTLRLLPEEPEEDSAEPVGAIVENQPRVKEVADEHLEAKLDRVLEKLSQQGQQSLTVEEREVLVKASEVYKRRRK